MADTIPAEFASVAPTLDAVRGGCAQINTIKTAEQFATAGELLKTMAQQAEPDTLATASKQLGSVDKALAEAEVRWLELSEKLESLEAVA